MAVAATYNTKQMRMSTDRYRKPALEGYMTSGEFRRRAIVKVNQFCDRNGIL